MNWKRLLYVALCLVLLGQPLLLAQVDDANAAMERGKRHYRNGNYTAALEELDTVVTLDPERADAHYLIGYCHFMLRQYPEGVEAFSRAFLANPELDPRDIY